MSDNKKSTKKATNKSVTNKTEQVKPKIDYSKLKKDTRLIPIKEFDWDRVVYGQPQTKTHAEGAYKMVTVQYMYDDETIGPLIVPLGKHYCFGVQPDNTDQEGNVRLNKSGNPKPLTGYKTPIVMTSQRPPDKPEPEDWETEEVDFFDSWNGELTRYAIENKKLIGLGSKKDGTIEDMVSDILYRKKDENGEPIADFVPKLYANLIYYPKRDKKPAHVGTNFYGPGDREMNISELKNHFNIHPNVRIDYLTVTTSVSAKVRLYDATVEPVNKAPPKRLAATNTMDASEGDFDSPAAGDEEDEENQMMESEDEGEVEYEEAEYEEED